MVSMIVILFYSTLSLKGDKSYEILHISVKRWKNACF